MARAKSVFDTVMCPFQAVNLPGTWVLMIAFSPESDWCFFEFISNS